MTQVMPVVDRRELSGVFGIEILRILGGACSAGEAEFRGGEGRGKGRGEGGFRYDC